MVKNRFFVRALIFFDEEWRSADRTAKFSLAYVIRASASMMMMMTSSMFSLVRAQRLARHYLAY